MSRSRVSTLNGLFGDFVTLLMMAEAFSTRKPEVCESRKFAARPTLTPLRTQFQLSEFVLGIRLYLGGIS